MTNSFLSNISNPNNLTENGAVCYSTTKSRILDYFSGTTSLERTQEEVNRDLDAMWEESPDLTIRSIIYSRAISREIDETDGKTTKLSGQGRRNEFRKSLIWLSKKNNRAFCNLLFYVPFFGCWKDILHNEIHSHGELTPPCLEVIAHYIGMRNKYPYIYNLLLKYLPTIRSKSNTKNDTQRSRSNLGKAIACGLSMTYDKYRKLKSSGTAHTFQRQMNSNPQELDFDAIPGIALSRMVNSISKTTYDTFLVRHDIVKKYENWIESKPALPFDGYPYQLMEGLASSNSYAKITAKKQFDGLVQKGRKNGGITGNVWVALDTSGSMQSYCSPDVTAHSVACSLGMYFSYLNTGSFKNHAIAFNSTSSLIKFTGNAITDYNNLVRSSYMGSTNFLSVIKCIVETRKKNPNIPLEDYPESILVVSDMQFDPAGGNQTHMSKIENMLKEVGLPVPRMIWWQVNARGSVFHSEANDAGVVMVSGFDGSVITQLLGGEQTKIDSVTKEVRQLTPYENMMKVLDGDFFETVSNVVLTKNL